MVHSQDIISTLNEVFKGGTLEDMKVQGSIKMETGTDFSFQALTSVSNNGWGLEASLSVKDGKCDFREVALGAKLNILPPKNLQNIMKLLRIPVPIPVTAFSETINFMPNGTPLEELRIDAAEQTTNPSLKLILEQLGADASFSIKNPTFMVTGLSFQMFFKASVMGPTAKVCTDPSQALFKSMLLGLDDSLCTLRGGIEITETNLGQQLKTWLAANNQPHAYIAEDGTITIGTDGVHCKLTPVKFSIEGKPADSLKCLGEADLCQSAMREALVNAVNARLPKGYKVDDSQFDNLKIKVDQTTGDVTINGDVYAGAGKDPSALVQALRDYVANGGLFKIGGQDAGVTKRSITDDGDCLKHADRVAAKACSPGDAPPSSTIPGGTSTINRPGDGDKLTPADQEPSQDYKMKNDGDEDKDNNNKNMLVVGTVLVTLAVVGIVIGTVVGIKIMRKRNHTTRPHNAQNEMLTFSRMEDTQVSDGSGFDSISITQHSTARGEQAVWGNVVDVKKF